MFSTFAPRTAEDHEILNFSLIFNPVAELWPRHCSQSKFNVLYLLYASGSIHHIMKKKLTDPDHYISFTAKYLLLRKLYSFFFVDKDEDPDIY